jgi:hypothetical protein
VSLLRSRRLGNLINCEPFSPFVIARSEATKQSKYEIATPYRKCGRARNDKSVGFPSESLAMKGKWAPYEEEGKITFQSTIISQVADL